MMSIVYSFFLYIYIYEWSPPFLRTQSNPLFNGLFNLDFLLATGIHLDLGGQTLRYPSICPSRQPAIHLAMASQTASHPNANPMRCRYPKPEKQTIYSIVYSGDYRPYYI